MQTQSAVRRQMGKVILFNLALDAVLAGGLAYWLEDRERGTVFLFLFVGFQVLSIALGIKSAIWSWIAFWLVGRKFMAAAIYDGLQQRGFPSPERYEESAEGYLSRIADDEAQPLEIRFAAVAELSAYRTQVGNGGISMAIQLGEAFEEAMRRMRGEQ